jgi:hypothetical protein
MSEQLKQAIENLYEILKRESMNDCIYVELDFSADGYSFSQKIRPHETIKREGINMRNLRGEFIKG